MKFIAVLALVGSIQAHKLSYDSAGGLLGEPEFMRAHPEWKIDSLLSASNEKMKQRPDHYLVGVSGDLVGYNDLAQTNGDLNDYNMNYAGNSFVGGNKNFETKYLLGADGETQK